MTSTWRHGFSGALGVTALMGILLADGVHAQDVRPRAIIILDGSGSMWGEIEGTPKIEAVQAGLSRLVDMLEGRADLGLLGYGARRKSDCKDIDLAFPPGRIDTTAAKAWLGKFSPRGKTPMAAALSAAGAALAEGGKGGHIIVVTDGADNCRADPCAVASGLAAANSSLRMHAIILGTTDEDLDKTRCIAEAGKGLVETVGKPADLEPALDRIMAAITGTAVPGGNGDAVAEGPPGLRLSLRLGPGGADVIDDVVWVVTRDGSEVYQGSTPRPALDLPPGSYLVTVTSGGIKAEQTIEAGGDGPTTAVLDLGAGIVRIALRAGTGAGEISDAYYTIYRTADAAAGRTTVAVGRGSPPPLLLPAGSYRAVFEQGLARIERALNVESGREYTSEIALDIGALKVSARAVEGGPLLENVYITVAEDDPEAAGGRREVATSAAAEPVFTLRAGLYHLKVEHGRAAITSEATVRGGEEMTHEVIVPSGRLELSSRISGSPEVIGSLLVYSVEGLDAAVKGTMRVNGPQAAVTLAAGRYRVTSQYGSGNARAQREVLVEAGSDQALVIEHDAGVVALGIAGQKQPRNAQWTIKTPDGATVWVSADPTPEVPLAAGDYAVEVRLGARVLMERFNVAPGEVKTVEVKPE